MAHRFEDLSKGLARSVARHGKLRRAGMMLALAQVNAPAKAEVSDDFFDCLEEYVNALAKCENTYSQAVGDADDAFIECLRTSKKKDFTKCFDDYDLALDNAILAFDGCQAAAAAKLMDCWGKL